VGFKVQELNLYLQNATA